MLIYLNFYFLYFNTLVVLVKEILFFSVSLLSFLLQGDIVTCQCFMVLGYSLTHKLSLTLYFLV